MTKFWDLPHDLQDFLHRPRMNSLFLQLFIEANVPQYGEISSQTKI